MKIFIDFDDVLFYSKKFIEDEKRIFKKYGISEEVFKRHYYFYSKKGRKKIRFYDLKKQLIGIKKELSIDTKKLEADLRSFLKNTGKYIFKDALSFLNDFKKEDLFLISYSKTEFQKLKIKNSGISKYFKKIIITNEKKSKEILENIENKKENIYFIDDRPDYITDVKKIIPRVKTIFMRRKFGRYSNLSCEASDWEGKTLREVTRILKNNE